MRRLLCIWFPNWPIQRLRLAEPSGHRNESGNEQPILLWKEDPRRGRVLIACCHLARRCGVKPGVPVSQASEIVQRSFSAKRRVEQGDAGIVGPLRIHPHDRQQDREAMEQIASLIQQRVAPLVAIESLDEKPWAGHPRHQSESLLCDITGVAHLFGGEAGLCQATEQLLGSLGLRCRLAIADSVGAAWGLAHYGHADSRGAPCIAPSGQLQPILEPLVVEALRLSPTTVGTLARLGVTHLQQLLRLPRSGLAPRLGSHLVLRIAQALGEVDEPLTVHQPIAEHRESLTLQYPTSDQHILADRVARLMKKIRAGLAACQRGALRMTCRLDLTDHPPLIFEIGLFAPTIDVEHLGGLINQRLEAQSLAGLVERLTLEVTLSGPLRSVQGSLFDEGASHSLSHSLSGSDLSRLIDALSGRLGRDAVMGVKMEENPLPEQAFTRLPLAGNHPPFHKTPSSLQVRRPSLQVRRLEQRKSSPAFPAGTWQRTRVGNPRSLPHWSDSSDGFDARQPSPDDPLRRPSSLLSRPVPLAVAFGNGPFQHEVTSTQLPDQIKLAGVIHAITASWGPERIETGWWQGPSVRRDYYRIETGQGRWWWIFRSLRSQSNSMASSQSSHRYRWMLHGLFD